MALQFESTPKMNLTKHWTAQLDDYVIDLAWSPHSGFQLSTLNFFWPPPQRRARFQFFPALTAPSCMSYPGMKMARTASPGSRGGAT
jgi:hypothetical protein